MRWKNINRSSNLVLSPPKSKEHNKPSEKIQLYYPYYSIPFAFYIISENILIKNLTFKIKEKENLS